MICSGPPSAVVESAKELPFTVAQGFERDRPRTSCLTRDDLRSDERSGAAIPDWARRQMAGVSAELQGDEGRRVYGPHP